MERAIENVLEKNIVVGALVKLTAVFWLIAKIISFKLWLSTRAFPTFPVLESLYAVPSIIHLLLLATSLIALVMLLVRPLSYNVIIIVFASEIASCILDQNRWQPWEYQYLFTFFILLLNRKTPAYIVPAFAFILCSTYFYSGLSKFNPNFIAKIWDRLILKSFFNLPKEFLRNPSLLRLGYALPFIEMICGVALLFKPARRIAAILLVSMHLFNLVLLGPLGLRHNIVVWPWNVGMILFLYILFIKQPLNSFNFSLLFRRQNILVLIFWGVLPLLTLIGKWDYYLSSNLYSANTPVLVMCVNSSAAPYPKELEPYILKDSRKICSGFGRINFTSWSLKELKVPCYPEIRIYKKIKKEMMARYPGYELSFFISGPQQEKHVPF